MVKQQEQLDQVFRALGDPTRRRMLAALRRGERSIGELAQPLAMTLAGASKHVQVLAEAGLIAREKRGRTHYCRLRPQGLQLANRWLQQYAAFWSERLDSLERRLAAEDDR